MGSFLRHWSGPTQTLHSTAYRSAAIVAAVIAIRWPAVTVGRRPYTSGAFRERLEVLAEMELLDQHLFLALTTMTIGSVAAGVVTTVSPYRWRRFAVPLWLLVGAAAMASWWMFASADLTSPGTATWVGAVGSVLLVTLLLLPIGRSASEAGGSPPARSVRATSV